MENKEKNAINFEVKLFDFNIILIVNKTNNIINEIRLNEIYRPFNNSLLTKLLENELSDLVDRFSNRFKSKEICLNEYIFNFLEYIKDLNKIYNSKCEKCKKNSKYSFTQKAFLPPIIKYSYVKYGNIFLYNRGKESLFFHPQCI